MTTLHRFGKHACQQQRRAFRFQAKLFGAALCSLLLALPASAEWTYSYTGSPFTHFVDQITDPSGSYTTNMAVSGFFIVENELPKGVWMYDLSSLLTDFEFTDGRQTLTKANAAIRDFKVSTNLDGNIYDWVIYVRVENALPDYIGETWGGPIILLGRLNSNVTPRYFDLAQITQCSDVFGNEDPPRCRESIWDRGTTNTAKGTWTGSPASTNEPPTADAGADQNIRYLGQLIELDGTGSHDDNTMSELLLYQWSFTSHPGTLPVLYDPPSPTPTFTANEAGEYILRLVVTDEEGLSDDASVKVSTDNLAPTAEAGENDIKFVGYSVSLDGSASSDPEGYPLTYEWTMSDKPEGSTAALTPFDTATPSFTPDLEGLYTAKLIVRDNLGPSLSDSVKITAVLPETFAEEEVVATAEFVDDLSNAVVTTKGNKQALLNFLSQALIAMQTGDMEEAIKKLEDAISRTDGCALRGGPDGNGKGRDWITECEAQSGVYGPLNEALNAIDP